MVGLKDNDGNKALTKSYELFDNEPSGQTPLCTHITKVVLAIESIAVELKSNNQKACVIIATDGLATDGESIHHCIIISLLLF